MPVEEFYQKRHRLLYMAGTNSLHYPIYANDILFQSYRKFSKKISLPGLRGILLPGATSAALHNSFIFLHIQLLSRGFLFFPRMPVRVGYRIFCIYSFSSLGSGSGNKKLSGVLLSSAVYHCCFFHCKAASTVVYCSLPRHVSRSHRWSGST